MKRRTLAWCTGLALFVAATNRYADPVRDYQLYQTGMGDAFSYIAIPLPLHWLFLMSVAALALGILFILAETLEDLSLEPGQRLLILAALALNPWAFRSTVAYPEMVNDLGFVFGLTVLLRGLVTRSVWLVIVGQLVASASRQTGLLLVPMVALWLWRGDAGSRPKRCASWRLPTPTQRRIFAHGWNRQTRLCSSRTLRDREADRAGRDGDRVRRPRSATRPARRAQSAAPGSRRGARRGALSR